MARRKRTKVVTKRVHHGSNVDDNAQQNENGAENTGAEQSGSKSGGSGKSGSKNSSASDGNADSKPNSGSENNEEPAEQANGQESPEDADSDDKDSDNDASDDKDDTSGDSDSDDKKSDSDKDKEDENDKDKNATVGVKSDEESDEEEESSEDEPDDEENPDGENGESGENGEAAGDKSGSDEDASKGSEEEAKEKEKQDEEKEKQDKENEQKDKEKKDDKKDDKKQDEEKSADSQKKKGKSDENKKEDEEKKKNAFGKKAKNGILNKLKQLKEKIAMIIMAINAAIYAAIALMLMQLMALIVSVISAIISALAALLAALIALVTAVIEVVVVVALTMAFGIFGLLVGLVIVATYEASTQANDPALWEGSTEHIYHACFNEYDAAYRGLFGSTPGEGGNSKAFIHLKEWDEEWSAERRKEMFDNLVQIRSFFRSYGLTDTQAAAIAGTLYVDTYLDPTHIQPVDENEQDGQWYKTPDESSVKKWIQSKDFVLYNMKNADSEYKTLAEEGKAEGYQYTNLANWYNMYKTDYRVGIGIGNWRDVTESDVTSSSVSDIISDDNTRLREFVKQLNQETLKVEDAIEAGKTWQKDLSIEAQNRYNIAWGNMGTAGTLSNGEAYQERYTWGGTTVKNTGQDDYSNTPSAGTAKSKAQLYAEAEAKWNTEYDKFKTLVDEYNNLCVNELDPARQALGDWHGNTGLFDVSLNSSLGHSSNTGYGTSTSTIESGYMYANNHGIQYTVITDMPSFTSQDSYVKPTLNLKNWRVASADIQRTIQDDITVLRQTKEGWNWYFNNLDNGYLYHSGTFYCDAGDPADVEKNGNSYVDRRLTEKLDAVSYSEFQYVNNGFKADGNTNWYNEVNKYKNGAGYVVSDWNIGMEYWNIDDQFTGTTHTYKDGRNKFNMYCNKWGYYDANAWYTNEGWAWSGGDGSALWCRPDQWSLNTVQDSGDNTILTYKFRLQGTDPSNFNCGDERAQWGHQYAWSRWDGWHDAFYSWTSAIDGSNKNYDSIAYDGDGKFTWSEKMNNLRNHTDDFVNQEAVDINDYINLVGNYKAAFDKLEAKRNEINTQLATLNAAKNDYNNASKAFAQAKADYYDADEDAYQANRRYIEDEVRDMIGGNTGSWWTKYAKDYNSFTDLWGDYQGNYFYLWKKYIYNTTTVPETGLYINWWDLDAQLMFLVSDSKYADKIQGWNSNDARGINEATKYFKQEVMQSNDGTLTKAQNTAYAFYYMFQYDTPYVEAIKAANKEGQAGEIVQKWIDAYEWMPSAMDNMNANTLLNAVDVTYQRSTVNTLGQLANKCRYVDVLDNSSLAKAALLLCRHDNFANTNATDLYAIVASSIGSRSIVSTDPTISVDDAKLKWVRNWLMFSCQWSGADANIDDILGSVTNMSSLNNYFAVNSSKDPDKTESANQRYEETGTTDAAGNDRTYIKSNTNEDDYKWAEINIKWGDDSDTGWIQQLQEGDVIWYYDEGANEAHMAIWFGERLVKEVYPEIYDTSDVVGTPVDMSSDPYVFGDCHDYGHDIEGRSMHAPVLRTMSEFKTYYSYQGSPFHVYRLKKSDNDTTYRRVGWEYMTESQATQDDLTRLQNS